MIICPFVGREMSDFCTNITCAQKFQHIRSLGLVAVPKVDSWGMIATQMDEPQACAAGTAAAGIRGGTLKTGFLSARLDYSATDEGIAV
jgi:hypothetical protein